MIIIVMVITILIISISILTCIDVTAALTIAATGSVINHDCGRGGFLQPSSIPH